MTDINNNLWLTIVSLDKQIYSVVFQSMGLVTLQVPGLPGFIISLN